MPIYVCLVEVINNILHVYFLMFAHSAVVFFLLYYMDIADSSLAMASTDGHLVTTMCSEVSVHSQYVQIYSTAHHL